jgi:predicted DCC family thiol-disulfide oxidoreductase YuxK
VRRAESLVRRVDAWVFGAEDARRLAAVRIGLCCLLALRLSSHSYDVIAGQPAALFEPRSYMHLFDRMPSHELAATLQICGMVAALVAAAGLALRVSLPLAFVCSLVLNGMLNSTGKVIYNDALLTLCLLVLVASGDASGEAWSMRELLRRALRRCRRGPAARPRIRRFPAARAMGGQSARPVHRRSALAGAPVRSWVAAARELLRTRAVLAQAPLADHPQRGRNARRNSPRDGTRLLGAMVDGRDRLRELACVRCVAAASTDARPDDTRGSRVIGKGESVVLYDRDCGFCKWSVDKILALDRSKRLRPVAIQSPEGGRLLASLDPEPRLDSWHLVTAEGELFSAGAAAAPLARVLPWGGGPAAFLGAFPGLTERAYRYIAAHRDRWARLLRIDANCELRRK